jgi:uncharacterized protein (DUF983 family)
MKRLSSNLLAFYTFIFIAMILAGALMFLAAERNAEWSIWLALGIFVFANLLVISQKS